jgi:hypothetical protein
MIERRDSPRFPLEACTEFFVGNFDCNGTPKARVASTKHLAHAAAAQQRFDQIGSDLLTHADLRNRNFVRDSTEAVL